MKSCVKDVNVARHVKLCQMTGKMEGTSIPRVFVFFYWGNKST